MSSSNETRKPTGRPSLLSAEQQNALEQHQPAPAAAVPQTGEAPRRKHVWLVGGLSALAIAAAFAVVQFGGGEAESPAPMLAAAPAPAPAPANVPAVAPAAAPAPADPAAAGAPAAPALVADTAPVVAAAAPTPAAATIVDEAPPPAVGKPKESLAQMLESGVPPAVKPAAAKPTAAKPVRKVAKERTSKTSDKAIAVSAPEQDNDVELLAALVAHAKFDATSTNARLSLPKALEQCKKQGKQDAARCRIRVCEGRWRKDECRVYSRSKLEKSASGA